jgi:thioredoxin-like negative regulator of GroEL
VRSAAALGLARLMAPCLTLGCASAHPAAIVSVSAHATLPATESAASATARPPPAFIEDDYPRAIAEATGRGLLLFVDAWAAWCHTCMSMRAYVLPEVLRRAPAERFVFLSLDTERAANAAAVTKLGVRVLPTLYVVDPQSERVLLAWPGSMTAAELTRLLGDVSSKVSSEDWLGRDQRADLEVTLLADAGRLAECARTAKDTAATLPMGTAVFDVLRTGLDCAARLPDRSSQGEAAAPLLAIAEQAVSRPSSDVLSDDRSDLYDYLVTTLRALGRSDQANRIAAQWATFLEDEAARAPTPWARTVFDAHRLGAYLAIGQPERAIPMLEQSARDFPDDYNPRARLATALLAMKRYDAALSSVDAALERAYGPRKLRIWSLKADILMAKGDRTGAKATLRSALDFAETAPLTASYPKLRDALAKRLSEIP